MEQNKHICKYCGKEFESAKKLGGHVSHCIENPKFKLTISKIQQTRQENLNITNPIENHICKCQYCGKEYQISYIRHNDFIHGRYNKTCSKECAHKLTNQNTDLNLKNKKISLSMKGNIPYNRSENFSYYKKCKYCGSIFDIRLRNSKSIFCCDDCKNKYMHNKLSEHAKNMNFGGYHPNSIKKHHHGNYKGIHCDSSWELAYLVWCLDHNIKIERCKEIRYYKLNKKLCKYLPDFVINDNEIIEIKGYYDKTAKIKSEQNPDIKVLLKDDLIEQLNYVITKYGKEFWKVLYD